jgi:hypothetical protein
LAGPPTVARRSNNAGLFAIQFSTRGLKRKMPSNAVYLIGFAVVILGLAYGAYLMGASPEWITAGVITLVGLGLLKVAKRGRSTRPFDAR